MSETTTRPANAEPCGHPCKCHAINAHPDCNHPRTSLTLNIDEAAALKNVFRECGPEAAVEMVNRFLVATAAHQHAEGIKAGELWERVRIEQAMKAVINPPRTPAGQSPEATTA